MLLNMVLTNAIKRVLSLAYWKLQEILMADVLGFSILIFLGFKTISRPKVLHHIKKNKNQSRRNESVGTEMMLNQRREWQKSVAGKWNPKIQRFQPHLTVTANNPYCILTHQLWSVRAHVHQCLGSCSSKWPDQINPMVFSSVSINTYRLVLRKPNLTKLQFAWKKPHQVHIDAF